MKSKLAIKEVMFMGIKLQARESYRGFTVVVTFTITKSTYDLRQHFLLKVELKSRAEDRKLFELSF